MLYHAHAEIVAERSEAKIRREAKMLPKFSRHYQGPARGSALSRTNPFIEWEVLVRRFARRARAASARQQLTPLARVGCQPSSTQGERARHGTLPARGLIACWLREEVVPPERRCASLHTCAAQPSIRCCAATHPSWKSSPQRASVACS